MAGLLSARKVFEDAIERERQRVAEGDPAETRRLRDLWLAYAELEKEKKQWKQAVTVYESAVGSPPTDQVASVWTQYAQFCRNRNKLKNADKIFLRALSTLQSDSGREEVMQAYLEFRRSALEDTELTLEVLRERLSLRNMSLSQAPTPAPAAAAAAPTPAPVPPVPQSHSPPEADIAGASPEAPSAPPAATAAAAAATAAARATTPAPPAQSANEDEEVQFQGVMSLEEQLQQRVEQAESSGSMVVLEDVGRKRKRGDNDEEEVGDAGSIELQDPESSAHTEVAVLASMAQEPLVSGEAAVEQDDRASTEGIVCDLATPLEQASPPAQYLSPDLLGQLHQFYGTHTGIIHIIHALHMVHTLAAKGAKDHHELLDAREASCRKSQKATTKASRTPASMHPSIQEKVAQDESSLEKLRLDLARRSESTLDEIRALQQRVLLQAGTPGITESSELAQIWQHRRIVRALLHMHHHSGAPKALPSTVAATPMHAGQPAYGTPAQHPVGAPVYPTPTPTAAAAPQPAWRTAPLPVAQSSATPAQSSATMKLMALLKKKARTEG
uniref:Suppressor of forked domain-containing protein n=1 Tax=Rhizochromulina marina TaxID=1034831 RepID=A0A7S2WF43_9STRA